MARFDLSDEEWAVIEPLLLAKSRGPERKGDRNVLNGIFYVLRTSAPWRDLPERYGPIRPSTTAMSVGENAVYGSAFSKRLRRDARTR